MTQSLPDSTEQGTTKVQREKSPPYPSYALDECMDFVKKVSELGGKAVAQASLLNSLGLTNPGTRTYAGKLSSSKQFGLLQASGEVLQLTETSKLLLYPTGGESQRREILIQAFKTPKLYDQLLNRFEGKKLPPMDVLANILMNEYRLSRVARDEAAKTFIRSAQFVGLMSNDGLLGKSTGMESPAPRVDVQPGSTGAEANPLRREEQMPDVGDSHSIQVVLTGGKKARIILPGDVSRADVERLKKMLDLLVAE